jgi:hypothetical protein
LPLKLVYGFSIGYIGNDVWASAIILLSAIIPCLYSYMYTLLSKRQGRKI